MSFFPHSSIQLSELLCTSRSNFFGVLRFPSAVVPKLRFARILLDSTKRLSIFYIFFRFSTSNHPQTSNILSQYSWKLMQSMETSSCRSISPFSSTESLAAVCWRVLCRTLLPALDASTIVVSRRGRFWGITSLCAGSWRGRMGKSHAFLVLSGNSQFLGCFQKQRCKWANNCSHSSMTSTH